MVGIDPGLTGAVAFINENGYMVEDLPTMANGKGSAKIKRCINPVALAELIKLNSDVGEQIYLERVSSMPGQGVASMFSMGDTFGAIRAVCAVIHRPLLIITPQEWKKHYKLGKDKELARAMAIQLFPKAPLSRKKDHNRSEALLIARYGQEKN